MDNVVRLGAEDKKYLVERIGLVEKKLFETQSTPPELNRMFRYAVSGGRRARAVMTLIACEACGGSIDAALPAALAIELGHKASLIRDDLVDGDEYRRGRKTFWAEYGERKAYVMADVLVSMAYKKISGLHAEPGVVLKIYSLISDAYSLMAVGQAKDVLYEKKDGVSPEEAMNVLYEKTAVLCEMPLKAGAILGGGTPAQIKVLGDYGRLMGTAFQILNDANNLSGLEKSVGRKKASDIARGKNSSVIAYAREAGDNEYTESIAVFKKKALDLMSEARGTLNTLPQSRAKEILYKLTDPSILSIGAYFGLLEGEIA